MNNQLKEGEIVIVVDCLHGHHFEIGETVEIIEANSDDYLAGNAYEKWWLTDEEVISTGLSVLEA